MALSGVHVSCGYAGSDGLRDNVMPVFGIVGWSESPSTGTPSTNAAGNSGNLAGQPIFRVYASAAVYLAVGPDPDETASPRHYIPASDIPYDIFVKSGDKFAWVAA